jgi:CBS domain-containing protein
LLPSLLILLVLILINAQVNGGFKVETSWIAVALSPTIIWLLTTGQLAELSGFGFAFKLREASAKPFSLSLEGDKIETALVPPGRERRNGDATGARTAAYRCSHLAAEPPGLLQQLGIGQYLEKLTQHAFFRYVVFVGGDGRFRGIVPARELLNQMRRQKLDLVKAIEEGSLDHIAGVVTASVPVGSSKRAALKIMNEHKLAELPVVNEAGQFVGIVDQDKLTSSILVDLVAQE